MTATTGKEFVISRTFDAPRDLVWNAWTRRDALTQWFGPKTPAEQNVFDTNHDSMRMGWTGTFEQLEQYLAKG